MNLFPAYQHTIHTTLTPEQARERICPHTRSSRPVSRFFCSEESMFWGTVDCSSFQNHYETIRARNSFTPQIRGTIVPNGSGTQITLSMALHPSALGFLTFYLCAALGFFLLGIILLVVQKAFIAPLLLFPLALILFSLFITNAGFKKGCRKAIRFLNKIL